MTENKFIISKIDDANKIHKNTYLSGLSRFTYLPSWLLFEAKIHEKECNSQIRYKYPYFKRGTIVMIDFGVNIDSEFSGKHFAIILNKKDNPNNPVLTVLPLTSKGGRNRFSIGKELFSQTVQLLTNTKEHLQQQASEIEITNLELQANVDDIKLKLESVEKHVENNSDFSTKVQEDIKQLRESINGIISMNNLNSEKISTLNKNQTLANIVINIYAKYNKESFVRISDIKTISKLRIHKLNKYDPSGKIKLSTDTMNSISAELINLYASR